MRSASFALGQPPLRTVPPVWVNLSSLEERRIKLRDIEIDIQILQDNLRRGRMMNDILVQLLLNIKADLLIITEQY